MKQLFVVLVVLCCVCVTVMGIHSDDPIVLPSGPVVTLTKVNDDILKITTIWEDFIDKDSLLQEKKMREEEIAYAQNELIEINARLSMLDKE